MKNFDQNMAADVIEDALMDMDSSYGRGVVSGLCGAFYMCGLLNEQQWREYLKRIPADSPAHIAQIPAMETGARGQTGGPVH